MNEFSVAQQMLTLSLVSYRGFWDPDRDNHRALAEKISEGLDELGTLTNQWRLLWGPTTYRYLGSIFDSSMMYVVQHKVQPWRIAVVVRGTNPVEIFDWLFGDFLTHRQVPWHHAELTGEPDAKVSLSVALGLRILLNMRCQLNEPRPSDSSLADSLARLGKKGVTAAQNLGVSAARVAGRLTSGADSNGVSERLRQLIEKLPGYLELWTLGAAQRLENTTYSLTKLLSDDHIVQMLSLRRSMIKLLDSSLDVTGVSPVAVLMPEQEMPDKQPKPGVGLMELLGALSEEFGGRMEISVTGHSKGGGLAPPLALYIKEKLTGYPLARQGIFARKGSFPGIFCYGFAGPTPGNGAFARYFNQELGRSFYRYANDLDMACLAWNSDRFRLIPSIYNDHVAPVPGLQQLVDQVADDVAHLDYCHPGRSYRSWGRFWRGAEQHEFIFHGPVRPSYKTYMMQWVHQHVDAYIEALGLQDSFDATRVMGVSLLLAGAKTTDKIPR